MVADIRKYTFVIYHRDYDSLLRKLRDAGVVHIVTKPDFHECRGAAKDMLLLKRYKKSIRQLSLSAPRTIPSAPDGNPAEVLDGLELKFREMEEAGRRLEILKPELEKAEPWGDFDPLTLEKLRNAGWEVSLFSCSLSKYQNRWEEEHAVEEISHDKGIIHFAIVHPAGVMPDIEADQEKLPERSALRVLEEIESNETRIKEAELWIRENSPVLLATLNKGATEAVNRIEYASASEQAERLAEGTLCILEGWVPVSEEKKVEEVIENSDCYALVSEPEKGDKIPVILRNSRFSSLFEPISKMFALPDYRELDLTPFFAPFFMMFFGFCLGDAGYGLLFVVAGFFIKRKVNRELRPIITLSQYFGVAAVLFGLISGTFFGINLIDSGYTITQSSVTQMQNEGVPGKIIYSLDDIKDQKFRTKESFMREAVKILGEEDFSTYRKIILKSTESDLPLVGSIRGFMLDSMNLFYLAIILGGLQIIFGMILRIVNLARVKGFKYSLSTVGWVILAITLIIFKGGSAIDLIDEEKFRILFRLLLIIAATLIFLFNTPHLNIFGRIGSGLWESYTIITGVFGDILSYIRLFALGISSSILGFVFNQISLQLLSVPYVGWLLFAVLLLFGHSLNLAIATLGSFVHPMRLTFVEFYKNAGFKGGGIVYKPFKIKK
jgi:V/A-type H+-transporting ATPase subunit I